MRLVTGMMVALAAGAAGDVWAQAQKAGVVPPGDGQTINRDFAATRYSPLTQINTSNVRAVSGDWPGDGTLAPRILFLDGEERKGLLCNDGCPRCCRALLAWGRLAASP